MILITGSNGFIGSNLCFALDQQSIEYTGVDLNNTGWVVSDIGDITKALLQHGRFTHCVNLAALKNARAGVAEIKNYWDTNVEKTKRLLECCNECQIPFLTMSSACTLMANQGIYGITKSAMDKLVQYYFAQGYHCNSLVLQNVYGNVPDNSERSSSLIDIAIRKAAKKDTLYLNNKTSLREYIYVQDVCNAIVAWIKEPYRSPINYLRNYKQHTNWDIVQSVLNQKPSLNIEYGNLSESDPSFLPSNSDVVCSNRVDEYIRMSLDRV